MHGMRVAVDRSAVRSGSREGAGAARRVAERAFVIACAACLLASIVHVASTESARRMIPAGVEREAVSPPAWAGGGASWRRPGEGMASRRAERAGDASA